ncbi:bifunctional methylenetetrahydrofolate dehydrogenase/methenyltetrahydrofolate cyclohydrolase FolD [Desulfobaculum sp.]
MILLDGKKTAAAIRSELSEQVAELATTHGRAPGLAVILVGDDPASQVYVRNKEKACENAGITSLAFRKPADVTQQELEDLIRDLNTREDVDGILLQLPLPKGLDSQACLDLIDPAKDVDGFHPVSMGRLALGLPGFAPCTPAGVIELLKRHNVTTAGKRAVIIGRSNIVGKPMAMMLWGYGDCANATVTVAHSRTPGLKELCAEADIIVAAIGRPHFVTGDMVKDGAIVIDVGINRTDNGLVGDCDFDAIKDRVSAITPVPGGVGPMTIAMLLKNTVQSYKGRVGA